MALATRPKPTVHHKKRRAQHHRHSKPYLKAYWPYIPVLMIVGIGAVINRLWAVGGASGLKAALSVNPQLTGGQSAARIQVLAGSQASWIVGVVSVIAATALVLFVVRDWYRLHRLINRGEAFIYKRPWLDFGMVLVFTAGFVLTSSNGIIR
jgi:uncharacterized membrane protein YidH (DUF202 family)